MEKIERLKDLSSRIILSIVNSSSLSIVNPSIIYSYG